MAKFSVTDAAFEGIRLTRETPRTVLLWALYYFGFTLALLVIAYLTLGPHGPELLKGLRQPPNDPAETERLVEMMAPFFDIAGPLGLVFSSMFTAAIYRRVLRPGDPRVGMRLGMDELRLLTVYIIMTLVLMATLFLVQLVALLTASAGAGPSALIGLAAVVGGIYLFVRLSLAGAASFSQGRLVVFQTWRLTDGQFWRLLAAYAMAVVAGLLVFWLALVLIDNLFEVLRRTTGIAVAGGAGGPATVFNLLAFLLMLAVSALVVTCSYVIWLAPPAAAYAALTAAERGEGN